MTVGMLLRNELIRSAKVLTGMALVLAMALSLCICASVSERMIRSSSAAAAERFDILVGARTSSVSLLLGTVYLQDEALPLIPASAVTTLLETKGVRWAAPVAFGDRAGTAPIVGTTRTLVTFGDTVPLAEGRVFEASDEAVVGSQTTYRIGDLITPQHGRVEGAGHAHKNHAYRVVGIMPAGGTPWDRAVLVPIESLWAVHTKHDGPKDEHDERDKHGHADDPSEPLEHWLTKDPSKLPGCSAVVVKPVTVSDAYRIRQQFSRATLAGPDGTPVNLTAVFTGEVLVTLYGMLGNAADVLGVFSLMTLAVSLLATLITGVLLGELRRPMLLQLRTLGAPVRYIALLIWLLVMSVVLTGTVLGLIGGWAASAAAGLWLSAQTGIAMTPTLSLGNLSAALGVLAVGALCALIPAFAAGRAKLS